MDDYFVVGPTITLQARIAPGAVPRLAVHGGGGQSEVFAACLSGCIRIELTGAPLPAAARIEALRLFARVADRRSPAGPPLFISGRTVAEDCEGLRADGFVRSSAGWLRHRGRFLRRQRTESLEEVYRDPFTVPWNFVAREIECMQPILDAGSSSPGPMAVLDLGFGFGKNATFLESRGFEVYGVEVSETATIRARELVRRPERFRNASAAAMPFGDHSFDAVLDVGCLHCAPAGQRPLIVREIQRVLRPGGLVSSRLFRPRDCEWVARQPFLAQSFGLSDSEAADMFRPLFAVRFWREDPDMIYLCGRRNPA